MSNITLSDDLLWSGVGHEPRRKMVDAGPFRERDRRSLLLLVLRHEESVRGFGHVHGWSTAVTEVQLGVERKG